MLGGEGRGLDSGGGWDGSGWLGGRGGRGLLVLEGEGRTGGEVGVGGEGVAVLVWEGVREALAGAGSKGTRSRLLLGEESAEPVGFLSSCFRIVPLSLGSVNWVVLLWWSTK